MMKGAFGSGEESSGSAIFENPLPEMESFSGPVTPYRFDCNSSPRPRYAPAAMGPPGAGPGDRGRSPLAAALRREGAREAGGGAHASSCEDCLRLLRIEF